MNDLQKAYIILGLEPGVSLKFVEARHKRLAKVWFPDFAPEHEKAVRTREMQHINHSRDVIREHLESPSHKAEGDCECRLANPSELLRQLQEARQAADEQRRLAAEARQAADQQRRLAAEARQAADEQRTLAAGAKRSDEYAAHPVFQSNFLLDVRPFAESWDTNGGRFRRPGYFHLFVSRPQRWIGAFTNYEIADCELSAEAQFVGRIDRSAYLGLTFRITPHGFYVFSITPAGFFNLQAYYQNNGVWETLLDWRFSEYLHQGDTSNVLTVQYAANVIDLWANSKVLARLADNRFSSGASGILLGNAQQPPVEARFWDVRISRLGRKLLYSSDFWQPDISTASIPQCKMFTSEGNLYLAIQKRTCLALIGAKWAHPKNFAGF
jgi:hypothetical protein